MTMDCSCTCMTSKSRIRILVLTVQSRSVPGGGLHIAGAYAKGTLTFLMQLSTSPTTAGKCRDADAYVQKEL